ncbi:hypothetical protein HPB50_002729 [Hyalomma asiaticum]|uniref:Uncharacterized protein n=1 Tax=Hyalomma asiaticum TaxID=266040 RepID=A0ACB7SFY1_HYAAI|nr:hypothetical protein HPB50_002729 [Hyalomma asiaticum]
MREPRRSSRCSKCRYYCRAGTTSLMSHFGLCSLVVGYCVMGAFLFEFLEATNERNKRIEMMRWRSNLADALWQLTSESRILDQTNWTGEAVARLRRFEVTLVQAVRKEGYDGKEDAQLQWSFSGALLYSIIVITTIGYGNIAPKTPQGKVVTILYAIVGIPLMLLCLSNIGDAMAQSFKFSYRYICCSICHRKAVQRDKGRYSRRNFQQEHQPHYQQQFQMQTRSVGRNMGQGASAGHGSSLAAPPSYKELSACRPSRGGGGYPPSSRQPAGSATGRRQADLEAARVPVISNKYALTEDAGGPAPAHEYRTPPARTGRRTWRDEGGELADDESVNALEDDDDDVGDEEEDEVVGSVPIWLCCAIVVGYICGGAWLFYSWEGWGYLDSAYFCFVTLTTIGFGDLVPGTALSDDQTVTLAVCAVYLLFGMALLAMSFNLVQEEVTRSVKCVGRRLGIISDRDDDR